MALVVNPGRDADYFLLLTLFSYHVACVLFRCWNSTFSFHLRKTRERARKIIFYHPNEQIQLKLITISSVPI